MDVVAIGAALGLAFVLGISSAPNAASALIASRAAAWRVALGYSFVLHAVGALLGSTAVALTIAGLLSVPADEVATVYASGCIATIAFGAVAARLGLPTSATTGSSAGSSAPASLRAASRDQLGRPRGVPRGGSTRGAPGARPLRSSASREDGSRGGSRCALSPVAPGAFSGRCEAASGWGGRRRPERRDERRSEGDGCGGGGLARDRKDQPVPIDALVRAPVAFVFALGTVIGGGRLIRRVGRGIPADARRLARLADRCGGRDPRLERRRGSRQHDHGRHGSGRGRRRRPPSTARPLGGRRRHDLRWVLTIPVRAVLAAVLVACASRVT